MCVAFMYLHGNGNTTNEQDKHIVNTSAVVVAEGSILNDNDDDHENENGANTKVTNLCKNSLQVTHFIASFANKLGSTTKEGVETSTNDHSFGFTLFTGGAGENFISGFLRNR